MESQPMVDNVEQWNYVLEMVKAVVFQVVLYEGETS